MVTVLEKDATQEEQDLDILEVVADRIREGEEIAADLSPTKQGKEPAKGGSTVCRAAYDTGSRESSEAFAVAASLATTDVDLALSKREKEEAGSVADPAVPSDRVKGSLTSNTGTASGSSNSFVVPGAYAEGGSVSENTSNHLQNSTEQTRSAPNPITSSIEVASGGNEDGQGLAVANAVDHPQDLPRAQDIIQDQAGTEQRGKTKSSILLFAVGVPVLAMVVLLIIFASGAGSGNEEDLDPLPDQGPPIPVSPPSPSSPAQAPTSLPEALLALLTDSTVQVDLDNPDLPQTRAFEWLVDDQLANSLIPERVQQRFILATLFYATGGGEDAWISNQGWLDHDVHECDWFTSPDFSMRPLFAVQFPGMLEGIFPDHPNDLPQQPCNVQGLYEHLWMDQNQLEATLPEELFLLTNLKSLSLALNKLQGTISTRIGQLTNLEALSIMGMAQEGSTVPSQIGLLTQARALVLAFNDHTGTVPSQVGLLSNLEHMLFGQNRKLTGSLPDLGTFPNLKWIIFDGCNMIGTIPAQIGDLSSLEYVILGGNSFSGTIPSQVGRLSKASKLTLTNNLLTGTIPTEMGLLTSCQLVDLDQNQLSGSVPSQFGLLTNLSLFLSFGDNPLLLGSIPTQLGQLTNLYDLNFANNNHSGPIPSEFGRLRSLGSLVLRNNSFTGSIPKELASLNQSMYVLDVRSTPALKGVVPQGLCDLNATCVPFSSIKCSLHSEGAVGMSFDCNNSTLCGCGCPCAFDIL